jgi:hypothetical protein
VSDTKSGGQYHTQGGRYGAGRVRIPIPVTNYLDRNQKFLEQDIHGGLSSLATGQALDSVPTDLPVTAGTGKLMIVVNAGADTTGDITVTGTTVDRETGTETGADTDTVTIAGLTTDGSDTDADGNIRHSFTNAYITSKWFKGATTLSTTNLTLTDVDVWQCSFEQLNDWLEYELDTFDINAYETNTNAWLYGYLYSVVPKGTDMVDIARESTLDLPAAEVTANKFYRLRRGNIGKVLNGTTDGFFVDLHLGPDNQTYWEDVTMKIWCLVTIQL